MLHVRQFILAAVLLAVFVSMASALEFEDQIVWRLFAHVDGGP